MKTKKKKNIARVPYVLSAYSTLNDLTIWMYLSIQTCNLSGQ